MKLNTLYLTGLLVLSALFSAAQEDLPLTNEAIRLLKEGRLEDARLKADEATLPGAEDQYPFAWYARGFIYKEVFKQTDQESKFSPNREYAVEYIQRCFALDKTGTYRSDCNKVLSWLARTYLRHAMNEIELIDPSDISAPDMYYGRYSQLIRKADPSYRLDSVDVDFYKKMAAALGKIYQRDPDHYKNFNDNSIQYYKQALAIDSLDYESNYNLAVTYFNEGVRNIRKINFETEIQEIIEIQDRCIRLFKQSEPYMIRAHSLRSNRAETLKGLYFLNRALNNEEQAAGYQAEIERQFGKQ